MVKFGENSAKIWQNLRIFGEKTAKISAIFDENFEIRERCKGVHCVDLGESFPTSIYSQKFASIQPRTSSVNLINFSSLQRFNFDRALASQMSFSSALPRPAPFANGRLRRRPKTAVMKHYVLFCRWSRTSRKQTQTKQRRERGLQKKP